MFATTTAHGIGVPFTGIGMEGMRWRQTNIISSELSIHMDMRTTQDYIFLTKLTTFGEDILNKLVLVL